jgi:hypothetical protein
MRAHGVPNYPDSLDIASTGINQSSQAFLSAEAKCYQLSPIASVSTHATDQQVRQALETTTCMRDHGVPNFPDPIVTSTPPARSTAAPAYSGGVGVGYSETYSNGILFKISNSIVSSPPFRAAANACNFNMPPG